MILESYTHSCIVSFLIRLGSDPVAVKPFIHALKMLLLVLNYTAIISKELGLPQSNIP